MSRGLSWLARLAAAAWLLSPPAAPSRAAPALDDSASVAATGSAQDSLSAAPEEPPASAPDGVDYEEEPDDSLAAGYAEADVGATGRGGRMLSRRRLRFSDGAVSGEERDAAGDALAGGSITARTAHGTWSAGRLRASWGRGLALGSAAEPWRLATGGSARGPSAGGRGDAVRWVSGAGDAGARIEALAGRFAGRALAGARVSYARVSFGVLVAGAVASKPAPSSSAAAASLALERGRGACELAMDRAGRWRAEAGLGGAVGGCALAARARGGQTGFRSLTPALRGDPAQMLGASLEPPGSAVRTRLGAALWRFRPGRGGARAALEFEGRLAHHARWSAGLEEQHGARRDPDSRPGAMRQGGWAEWRGGPERLALALRQELWGARPWARDAVRSVTTAGVALQGPRGARLRVTHGVYRTGSGESVYLAEAESDRLTLRALSGAGERTRIEIELPLARGVARAAAGWTVTAAGAPRVQWTVDWLRRASIRRSS
jgi:hypothetical protein